MGRSNFEGNCCVSIVVPAHNEAPYLDRCVRSVERILRRFTDSYEIILAEDGSTDGTSIIATRIAHENPMVSHIHSRERLGRGKALKTAFRQAKGETLIYLDADLPTNLNELSSLVEATENGHYIATGSRHLKASKVKRPLSRWATSMVYNLLVRIIFRDGIHDHQCGIKAFRRELVDFILDDTWANGWFLDTEIIVKSHKRGYPVIEVPIEWTENREKGESKVKLLDDSLYFIKNLMNLWLDLNSRRERV